MLLQIITHTKWDKVKPPKTNTMYHMHTSGGSKCMHVVIVLVLRWVLVLGGFTLVRVHGSKTVNGGQVRMKER